MRSATWFFLAALLILSPGLAAAQKNPVVVELYTSQGCSSCPPADAFLGELSKRGDVIPLAFHVTYWDRLGWKDTFGTKAGTDRQYGYSRQFGNRSVWTPQFVVQGSDYSRNSFRDMVGEYIVKHASRKAAAKFSAASDGDVLKVAVAPVDRRAPRMTITVVHVSPLEKVSVKRGENAGRTLKYHHVVQSFYDAADWNGRGEEVFSIKLKGKKPFAVILQERGLGPIHAAQMID